MNPRRRAVLVALGALVLIWAAAIAGQRAFRYSVITAEKLCAYTARTDLGSLAGEPRAKAIRGLISRINSLEMDERKKARQAHGWDRWFSQMTEQEKSDFVDATVPAGFKEMMKAFQKLPPERMRAVVEGAFKRAAKSRDSEDAFDSEPSPGSAMESLRAQVMAIGFINMYFNGSAQTRADLAPLIEELVLSFDSGRMFRGGGPAR